MSARTGLVDRVAPPRLGRSFRWLLASSWSANIGDGLVLAAGPLLVASQTDNAILVAMAALLQRLPWLLFGLPAGAVADRIDRRLLVMGADAARAATVGVLALFVVTGHVSIGLVLVVMFSIGVAEVFADTTSSTLLPMLVAPADLGLGNSRFQASSLLAAQLIGPPLGAFLFAVGPAWPFATQAVCVAMGVVLISRIEIPPGGVREVTDTHIRRDIADGIRWLLSHAAVRTLALVIFAFNVTWGAAWSVLVLYALRYLQMGEVGYGLLTTATAVGGIVGVSSYTWLERQIPLATLMRACLLLEVLTHLSLALATHGWQAIIVMLVFGAYAYVWVTVSQTVRQRAVPTEFQGRVSSVYMVGLFGGLLIGQALGGWIAEVWGLTAPFWFAFVGSGLTLALVWGQLANIAHAGEVGAAPTEA